ncbi:hypothetical protein [Haloarchaeobius sp. TZWSO28]|uniref:hypothetical protein n=1 Tax=Haloarchaeobius sp. TZWSO28 TaxID=3446119 RepID=UPI003EBAEAC5
MPDFEFGGLADASAFRDDHEDHLCPHDDRRQKTVTLVSDAPERVLDQAAVGAAVSREDRNGPGQIPLSDAERDRIDFTKARASVPHARAVKGIARDAGVDDWTAYYDATLTVDEHRGVMDQAAHDERGKRMDAERSTDEKLADVEAAVNSQCDHAVGHCENGEVGACEFLQSECGFSEDRVEEFLSGTDLEPEVVGDDGDQGQLVTVGGGEFPEMDVTPQEAGALHRSWQGYKGAIGRLDREIGDVREAVTNARGAVQAINAVRDRHGQDPMHPDRLHELLETLDGLPGDIPEVRTLAHFADSGEDVIEHDEQRDLSGENADDQTRFSGQDRRDLDPETVENVEENEGGLMADTREGDGRPDASNTEQQIPEEFQVAEGGQETL